MQLVQLDDTLRLDKTRHKQMLEVWAPTVAELLQQIYDGDFALLQLVQLE